MRGDERSAREQAARLIEALPEGAQPVLRWRNVDLTAAAEHLLYTAMLRPAAASERHLMAIRSTVRAVTAGVHALRHGRTVQPGARVDVLAMVTQPIHATLFAPIERELADRGARALVVDAETRRGRSVPGAGARMADSLRPSATPSLIAHAMTTASRLAKPPDTWGTLLPEESARRLWRLLARGLPILALDAARIDGLLSRYRPRVIACFSESGQLARLAPAVGRTHGIPVVDLPHAEAADPWGSAGLQYDAVAVYGPSAADTMRLAGIESGRIHEIGPLRFDSLIKRGQVPPNSELRRVVFASQPSDADKPALPAEWKRSALRAALAAAERLSPAELVIVPHPTETDRVGLDLLRATTLPEGVTVRVADAFGLYDALDAAWLLVTAWSQSTFEAVIAGVPCLTVVLPGQVARVSYAADGIAIGVQSPAEAAEAAGRLSTIPMRAEAARAALLALGRRLGPLDGRAAGRAAEFLIARAGVRDSQRDDPTAGSRREAAGDPESAAGRQRSET